MPTYKNETSERIGGIKTSYGSSAFLEPGETIETTYFCDHDSLGLTEISETPYWNRVADSEDITDLSETPQNVEINNEVSNVVILNITDTVTVCRNVSTADPEMKNHENSFAVPIIPVDKRTKRLVLTGSGNCRVVQWRDMKSY